MKPAKKLQLLLLILTAGIFSVTAAQAHKIRIFAWQEGGVVYAEAKFSGGKPARRAAVIVENPVTHETLVSGTTDEDGNFQFPIPTPAPEQLVIIIDGGDGHRNSWTHILETAGADTLEPTAENAVPLPGEKQVSPEDGVISGMDAEQLEAVLERVVDKKLAPIKKSLAAMQDKGPSLQDILGGIGYIIGLAGIAAYFKSKKQ